MGAAGGRRVRGRRDSLGRDACGCGCDAEVRTPMTLGTTTGCTWQRRTSEDSEGVHVRRRTGRSVGVLYLLLVLAVLGCWLAPSAQAWPTLGVSVPSLSRWAPRWPPRWAAARSLGARGMDRGLLDGWSTDAILDRLQRLGSSLLSRPASSDSAVGKVLNFFPVPVSDECLSSDGRRTGICLNTYECRIQNGKSYGPCALGFGVCCVFTASCGDVVENNVTYFVSPNFPAITRESSFCELEVKKVAPDVSQLRLDFIHFSMGQPNRRTGVCESDTFVIAAGTDREFSVCGQNSGQHIYFDVEDMTEPITIVMNMSREHTARLWEIKVTQIEFQQRAPSGCLQYHQDGRGVIQTMNFAENGRHLANQDYTICMRQAEGMCSIVYEPCDENSFKIGPAIQPLAEDAGGSGESAIGEAREQCSDKIVMPCDSEEFLTEEGFSTSGTSGLCDLLHCGNSFCSPGETTCRIESSTTPFNIRVMFGPAVREESPEDNLGMCLKYEQQPCVS